MHLGGVHISLFWLLTSYFLSQCALAFLLDSILEVKLSEQYKHSVLSKTCFLLKVVKMLMCKKRKEVRIFLLNLFGDPIQISSDPHVARDPVFGKDWAKGIVPQPKGSGFDAQCEGRTRGPPRSA
jgi:hypothetical protein